MTDPETSAQLSDRESRLGTNVPAWSAPIDVGAEFERPIELGLWRLVMVPEARRGERGQEPAAADQSYPQRFARPRRSLQAY